MTESPIYRNKAELLHQLPLFYQPWWLDVVARNWKVVMSEENGKIVAVFPFQTENKFGIKLLRNPPLCPYLGPLFLFKEETDQKQFCREENILEALWAQLPRWGYLQFTTIPGFQNTNFFSQRKMLVTNRITYLIDLNATEEAIFSRFQPRLRSYIRKAEKGLKVEVGVPEDLSPFYSFHQIPFTKKKTPYPFTLDLIKNIIHTAESHQASLFQTAFDEQNRPVAMLWTPFDSKTAYHLLAATNPESVANGALALLVWKAIQFFKQKGLACYDFEGSMDKGIEQFFKKFGGERNTYLFFEQNRSRIWKIKKHLLG